MDRGILGSGAAVRRTRATIDTAALGHNLAAVRRQVAPALVLGVVKADAYGHGARLVGPALAAHGIDWMGVGLVEEGLELRQLGVKTPLLVLDGAYGEAYDALLAERLTPVVFRTDHLEGLAAAARRSGELAQAHLKIDTGMSRLGVLVEEVTAFALAAKAQGVAFTGLCTHFANADAGDPAMAARQLRRFAEAWARVREAGHAPELIHLANSAAALELPEARQCLVRPGLLLYGQVPAPRFAAQLALQPVLRWTTEVVQVKWVPAGTPVSYGGRFVTGRRTRLAVLAVGYGDGLRRDLSGKGEVLLRGQRVPIIGAIAMDLCVADATDLPDVAAGDEVVLLGSQGSQVLSPDEHARHCDTIAYEILCGISSRVPRFAAAATFPSDCAATNCNQ